MLLSYTNSAEMATDFSAENWQSLLDSIPTEIVKETPVENDEVNDSLSTSVYLSSSVYLSPRAGARARVEKTPWDETAQIYAAYQDAFGRNHVALTVRREIAEMMDEGARPDLIVAALETAADAPRPSWAYARATVRRCLSEGVTNGAAFAKRTEKYRARKAQFAERQIENDEFERGFYIDVMGRNERNV